MEVDIRGKYKKNFLLVNKNGKRLIFLSMSSRQDYMDIK